MRKGPPQRRVPHGPKVIISNEALIPRARAPGARNRLAIRAREPSGDVERKGRPVVDGSTAEVPEGALAAPLWAIVAPAVLGENAVGGDAGVVADDAYMKHEKNSAHASLQY